MLNYKMPMGTIKIGDSASYFQPCKYDIETMDGAVELPMTTYRPRPDGITKYRNLTAVEAEAWYNKTTLAQLSTGAWKHRRFYGMEAYEKMASWNHAITHNRDRLFILTMKSEFGSRWEYGYIASNHVYWVPLSYDYPIFTKNKGLLTRYYRKHITPVRIQAVSNIIYASNYGVSLQEAAFKDQAELFGIFKGRHPDYYGYAQYELIDAIVDTKLRPYYGA